MNTAHEGKTGTYQAVIAILAALFFLPFLGGVHLFDWDEINFAESAREMIKSGDYLTVRINFVPFWEKPPLFIWMQVLSMKIFGINEFAARFPNAICGIVTLVVLFTIGSKMFNLRFGLIWTLLYAGSILPFFYFKSGIIDPWFNLFIFLGVYQLYLYFNHDRSGLRHALFAGLFIGLAILTKGPVALLVVALTTFIYLLIKKFRVQVKITDVLVFSAAMAFTGGFWFILQLVNGNFSIIADFIVYQIRLFKTQDAGHGGFLLYHFVILFFGVFPASVYALPALFSIPKGDGKNAGFLIWILILFWVVLILFTIVRTKIVHYSSLCYFPLTFAASWAFCNTEISGRWKKTMLVLIMFIGTLLALVFMGLTAIDHFKDRIIGLGWIGDPFAVACLEAHAGWKGYEFVAGLILLVGLMAFYNQWKRNRQEQALMILTATVPLFLFLSMMLIVPRIEAYSQRTAIEFFKSVSREDAYFETVGYKSYAHLFYGNIRNHAHDNARNEQWLLTGDTDKRAYFSIKITRKEKFMQEFPHIEYMYEKNGFVFFRREPVLKAGFNRQVQN
ncbi:MAG: glycosyltransferase family 39 protein [Bacteroidales bacterium]|nr:glycosyltransferase family 39 protein [Bacteroidales bacterium]